MVEKWNFKKQRYINVIKMVQIPQARSGIYCINLLLKIA